MGERLITQHGQADRRPGVTRSVFDVAVVLARSQLQGS